MLVKWKVLFHAFFRLITLHVVNNYNLYCACACICCPNCLVENFRLIWLTLLSDTHKTYLDHFDKTTPRSPANFRLRTCASCFVLCVQFLFYNFFYCSTHLHDTHTPNQLSTNLPLFHLFLAFDLINVNSLTQLMQFDQNWCCLPIVFNCVLLRLTILTFDHLRLTLCLTVS